MAAKNPGSSIFAGADKDITTMDGSLKEQLPNHHCLWGASLNTSTRRLTSIVKFMVSVTFTTVNWDNYKLMSTLKARSFRAKY